MNLKYLSEQRMSQYQRDGFLVIPHFLTAAELAAVQDDIARVSQRHATLTRDKGGFNLEKIGGTSLDSTREALRPGMLRKIQGAVFYLPSVRDVFTSEKMIDCMEDILASPNIYYHSSKVMFKPPRGGSAKPWHQDAAYWKHVEPNQVTVWIAIDDATEENGCVWAIPGSQRWGLVPHVGRELHVPESDLDLRLAKAVPVQAGGLLIFHSLVLHMSKPNLSDKPRCAIICDYDSKPNPCLDVGVVEQDSEASRPPGIRADGVWPLRERALAGAAA